MPLCLADTAISLAVMLLDDEKVVRYDYFMDTDNFFFQVFTSRTEIEPRGQDLIFLAPHWGMETLRPSVSVGMRTIYLEGAS